MGYYERRPTTIDGESSFATPADAAGEAEVAATLERAWGVEIHRYCASFSAIDWYAVRRGRLVAHVEVKGRSHDSTKYPTVYLNFRKYHNLFMAWVNLGVPSIFVVRFLDGIRWIDVRRVDARRVKLGGCSRIVKARTDIEPVIEVPVERMKPLKPKRGN